MSPYNLPFTRKKTKTPIGSFASLKPERIKVFLKTYQRFYLIIADRFHS